jgi:hypothetical protein
LCQTARYAEQSRLRHSPLVLVLLLSAAFLFLMAGAGCVSPRHCTIVEFDPVLGIRTSNGSCRYMVGGAPQWRWSWHLGAPAWSIEDDPDRWRHIVSGDVSQTGLLAVARKHPVRPGVLEVSDFCTGTPVASVASEVVAVAWAPDGTTLACVEGSPPDGAPDEGAGDCDTYRIVLRTPQLVEIKSWQLQLTRLAGYVKRLSVSWNASGTRFAVSSPWLQHRVSSVTAIIDIQRGPVCRCEAKDAYFVSDDKLVMTFERDGVWLTRFQNGELVRLEHVSGGWTAAASDPAKGVFLTWSSADWWVFKVRSLPLLWQDLSGSAPVRASIECSPESTIRILTGR